MGNREIHERDDFIHTNTTSGTGDNLLRAQTSVVEAKNFDDDDESSEQYVPKTPEGLQIFIDDALGPLLAKSKQL